MRDPEEVRDDLHRAIEVLGSFSGDVVQAYPGIALMHADLLERQAHLREELKSATTPQLDFVIDGEPVSDHTVQVSFVATALGALQRALASVGQGVVGEPTSQGPIAGVTRDAVALRLAAVAPGSVELHLLGPAVEGSGQTALPVDSPDQTVFGESVELVLNLIDTTREENIEDALVQIAGIGKRAAKHLGDLSAAIAGQHVQTTLRWRYPARRERIVNFDGIVATSLQDVLTKTVVEESNDTFRGRLVGASLPKARFDLQLESGDVISGRVDPSLIEDAKDLWLRMCVATIRIAVARSPADNREARSYTLVAVEEAM